MKRFFFFLLLAIFGAIGAIALMVGINLTQPVQATDPWRPIEEAPAALVRQFLRDQPNPNIPIVGATFLSNTTGSTPLYLIDTNGTRRKNEELPGDKWCGVGGCVFAGYRQQGQIYEQVTQGYVTRFVPQGVEAVEVLSQQSGGLPCLQFNQPDPVANSASNVLAHSTWCFDGSQYTMQEKTYSRVQAQR